MSALTAVTLLAAATTVSASFPPKFCKDLNCPNFTVSDRCGDGDNVIEIRDYLEAEWVGAQSEGKSAEEMWDVATTTDFFHDFNYISGENSENIKIVMTAPVKMTVAVGDKTTIRTEFYLPYKYQPLDGNVKPPTPTNEATTLRLVKPYTLAVRSFGGYTNSWVKEVQPQIETLSSQLKKSDIAFDEATTIVQGYDSPFDAVDRHNEVAYVVKPGTKCSK